jgi:hypothetical protein
MEVIGARECIFMEQNSKRYAREAILRGLRWPFGATLLEELRAALSRITDWSYLLQIAIDQGVFQSLYRQVADSCPEVVPPEVLVNWQRLYRAHAQRNLRVSTELIQVLNLLADNGIIAVSYKGPLLAAVAYGDITFRQFVDLDILVSRKDIGRVKNMLFSQGYRLSYSFTTKQERAHLKGAVEYTFSHTQRARLDVHWRFAADYLGVGPNPEEAIARRMPVKILEKTVYTLDPEENLLVICLNGALHLWSKLGLINDLALLIKVQAVWDWPGLLKRAKELGMRRQVLLGLSLAQNLLGAPVPREIIREADADPNITALYREVRKNIFVLKEKDLGLITVTAFYLKTRDRFKDKLTHVLVRLAIPTVEDWRWVPLPDSLYWLYYLIRPLRLGLQGLVLPLLQRFQVLLGIKAYRNHH